MQATSALSFGVLCVVLLSGCAQPQAAWQEYERPDWEPGHRWTYESASGGFTVEVLRDVRDFGDVHLASWTSPGTTPRLVSIDQGALGRHQLWADPIEFMCGHVACGDAPTIRYPDQVPMRGIDLFPGRVVVRPDEFTRLSLGGIHQWRFQGMQATYHYEVFGKGPVKMETQAFGMVEVIEMQYRIHLTDLDAKFEAYAQQRAAEGLDVLSFQVDAQWGLEARNLVHAAVIGDDPDLAFSAGFVFGGFRPVAREFWLTSFDLTVKEPMPPEKILETWGRVAY